MFNKTLLFGAFYLISMSSFAQKGVSIDSRIAEKEILLENSKASSRQVNESLKSELLELYNELKLQLESEIATISDLEIKGIKNQELTDLNNKIASYSQKK